MKKNLLKGVYSMKKLVKDIVNYMNEVNRGKFTKEELSEFENDYVYMIKNGQKENIINVLKDEYTNSKDVKALEFIKEIECI